jgi:cytochrome b involved in lipid metabolism
MVSPNIYRRKQLSEAAGTGSDSAYVLLQGKVYDVRDFVPEHPGGDVILSYVNSGEDAIGN